MNGESLDMIRQKKALLESAMPEVFSEGRIDCDNLTTDQGKSEDPE